MWSATRCASIVSCVLLLVQSARAQSLGDLRNPFNNKPIREQIGDGSKGPQLFPRPRESYSEIAVVTPPSIDRDTGAIYSGSGSGGRIGSIVPGRSADLYKANDGRWWWGSNYRNIFGSPSRVVASDRVQNLKYSQEQQAAVQRQEQERQQQQNQINQENQKFLALSNNLAQQPDNQIVQMMANLPAQSLQQASSEANILLSRLRERGLPTQQIERVRYFIYAELANRKAAQRQAQQREWELRQREDEIRRREEEQRRREAYRPIPPQVGTPPLPPQLGTAYIPRRLGVNVQVVDVGGGELGLQITGVSPGAPAHRAGLEPGDVIVRVNNQRVRQPQELVQALTSSPESPSLRVRNVRNGQYIQVYPDFD